MSQPAELSSSLGADPLAAEHRLELLKSLDPHVFHRALLWEQLDLETYGNRPTLPPLDPRGREWRNPVDLLIEESKDLWNDYIKNKFCWTMATSSIAADPRFLAYAIQDYVWIWEWVRHVARETLAAPTIPILAAYSKRIHETYVYALNWRKICVQKLGIDGQDLDAATPVDPIAKYQAWMKTEGDRGVWLDLHVILIPCFEGYYRIAQLIENTAKRPLNEKFHEYWVKTNNTDLYSKRVRKFFEENRGWYYSNPAQWARWTKLFRQATEFEISVFDFFISGLKLPPNDSNR